MVDTVRDNNPDAETVGEALDTYEARKGTEEYDESEEGDMAGGEDGEPTEGETDSAMVEETLSEG